MGCWVVIAPRVLVLGCWGAFQAEQPLPHQWGCCWRSVQPAWGAAVT